MGGYFWAICVCVCACSTDSELQYLLGISESLQECHSADNPQNIVQHSDNTPYTCGLSHLTCSAAVFGHETNCSRTKLYVTADCYRDSRTDSIHHFSPVCGIQQKATAGPTAIAIRTSSCTSTNGSTDVAKCVCVCVCVCVCARAPACVCRRAVLFVTGLGFVYIMLCTDYVQITGNPLSLMHFCVQGNTYLWFRVKKI